MNIRRIECFLAVVDLGTVTAAAQSLFLAQPALSRQLQTLEQELDLKLFDHQRNRLSLTPAGRELVPLARQLLSNARSVKAAASSWKDGRIKRLYISATAATINELIAPFITTLPDSDPLLLTVEAPHFNMLHLLHDGIDMVVSPTAIEGDVASLYLGQAPLRAYVSPDHPWARAQRQTIALDELVQHELILPGRQSVSRLQLDLAVARAGLAYQSIIECGQAATIQALAVSGRGIGIVTDLPRYGAYDLHILDAPGSPNTYLGVDLYAAWSHEHYSTPVLGGIAARMRDYLLRRF
ncbi:LysR family transcriptional regulator [Pseudomonas sp. Teo4]|uniref:LysR family transcriptional regulator n=1 Tax=Pseudomonas sp. Teo4 TaxID=3064528 RepID=UPI002AB86DEE|nr:LysR family transcriptional regulator [Pseudomonas sp. Teo4]MDZ3992419.1 HTH-type transcriptional regulator CysB [Pseudomonas sp. Teo4]